MITLMTGGSACGKSSYAESLAVRLNGPRYYLAAMQPYGEGGAEKIARHRKMRRGKGFETIERYRDYASLELENKGGTERYSHSTVLNGLPTESKRDIHI